MAMSEELKCGSASRVVAGGPLTKADMDAGKRRIMTNFSVQEKTLFARPIKVATGVGRGMRSKESCPLF